MASAGAVTSMGSSVPLQWHRMSTPSTSTTELEELEDELDELHAIEIIPLAAYAGGDPRYS